MADIGTLTITLGVNAQGLMTAQTAVKEFTDKVGKIVKPLTPALQEPFQLFSKSAISHLAMTSQRLRTFGYLASAAITAPMVLAGKSIVKMASAYEFSMQKIVGLTGTAQGVVDEWSKSIQNMAKDFGRKPQELAEGLYFIASSGIEGAQALDVLEKSAKAAATGLGTTQEVANYLTSVLNAYRGTGLTAAYATDVLVAAVREGKAEASGFAAAMGSLVPIASNLGVSIDQVAGAMAGITLTGSSAAQAATYLRGVFNVLMKETEQGATAMDVATKALGQMKTSYADLRKILREQGIMALMQRLNELSAAYGETLVSKVFPNIRAMLGVLSLSGKNMQYNSQIIKDITNSSGALGKAFEAIADTMKFRYDRALSSVHISMIDLGKSIGVALLPMLEKLVVWLDNATKRFNALSEEQKNSRIKLLLWIAALGPATMALSVLGYTLTGLMNIVNSTGKLFIWLSKTITISSTSMTLAQLKTTVFIKGILDLAKAFKTLGVAILATPIGWFNIALAGAVAFMAKKVKEVKAQIKELQDALAFNTPAMDLDKEIGTLLYSYDATAGKYTSNLKNLTNEELYHLQSLVDQRLSFAKESLNNAKAIGEKEIANDKFILEQKKIIADAEQRWEYLKVKEAYSPEDLKMYGANISLEIQKANKEIDKYIANRKNEISYDKESAQTTIEYYNTQKKAVDEIIAKRTKEGQIIGDAVIPRIEELTEKVKEEEAVLASIFRRYQEGVNYIEMMNKVSKEGTAFEFDVNTEKLQLAKQTLESFVTEISKFGDIDVFSSLGPTMGIVGANIEQIMNGLTQQIQRYKKALETIEDEKQLKVLQMEADAFGNLAGKIEVVNYALQAAQRDLRNMFSANVEQKGLVFSEEEIKKTVSRIQMLKTELVSLQNTQEMTWLNDMDNALKTADTGADILSGRISGLSRKLQILSENGQGGTEMFKQLAQEMKMLTDAQEGVDILAGAFNDLFQGLIDGSKNIGEILGDIFKQIIRQISEMIAKLIATRILLTLIGGPLGNIGTGTGLGNIPPMSPLIGGGALAYRGGVVPPGYPNDTYPAMLTSGETIVPALKNPNVLGYEFQEQRIKVEIEGVIKGKDIALALRRNE